VLCPATVNVITAALPPHIKQVIADWLAGRSSRLLKYPKILNSPAWTLDVSIKYHLMYCLLFLSLFFILVVFRWLTRFLLGGSSLLSDLAPAIGMLFLPLTFFQGSYYYDFPELLFMGLLLVFMLKRNWLLYHLVFFLAVLNKESNALLLVFYAAMMFNAISRKEFWLHFLIQGLVGVAIVASLRFVFWNFPGTAVEYQLAHNLDYLFTLRSYRSFTDIYAPMVPVPTPLNILLLSFLFALVFYGWKRTPIRIRRLFLLSSIVIFPLVLFFGWIEEARVYSFMFPALYFIAVYSVVGLYGDRPAKEASIQSNSAISSLEGQ
jgi:hypothetical protein